MKSFEALVRQHIRSGGLASRTQTKQAVFVKTVFQTMSRQQITADSPEPITSIRLGLGQNLAPL